MFTATKRRAVSRQKPTPECVKRLARETKEVARSPPDNILACPSEDNLLVWHYVLLGPEDSPYDGGVYHGQLVFPHDYPHAPPAIYMSTPSGRFEIDTKLCLSMSDFHPESWSPAWSVSSILVGLLSFMLESEITAGSITTSAAEKRTLAAKSLDYNAKNADFRKLFPYLLLDDDDDDDDGDDGGGDDGADGSAAAAATATDAT
mmetsp:Transcript_44545/g.109366  ORF Transcript_44545/g.109366 Transcript_44545/m.109366 type:complete len:204 (-) Transcript_44545:35-646(-)